MSQNSLLPIFDPQTLEQLFELVDGDDASFLLDLFESYLTTARESIETLRQASDHDLLRRAAHTLKGSSLNVGASRVADLCKVLEQQLRADQTQDLAAQVERIEDRVQQVHEHYAAAIDKLASGTH
jgi:HPt (histidine-containing phosphotransfer) domain-containing protein